MPLAPAPTTPIDDATGTAAATETDTPSVPAAPTGTLELEDAHRPAEADPTATHRTGAPLHVPHDQGAPPTHDVEAETAPRPSAPAPDARPEPVAPWEQLARAVQTARRHQDGSHTMTVRLDPPELGTVELHLRVHDGQLSVHALTDSLATRDVISRALPDLRAALESGGLHAGSLDVGARSSGQGPEGRNADNAPGGMRSSGGGASSRSDDVSVARASRGTSEPSSRLDLRL
jgi:flagellar hook-length control protein FliK